MGKRGKETKMRVRDKLPHKDARHDPNLVRNSVLFLARQKLLQHDGRAAGIKFNKLMFYIYKRFSEATNPDLHFDIPYRWYLYGAVIDPAELGGVISFDHDDDEIKANVHWTAPVPAIDVAAGPEIELACEEFCKKFPGTDYYGDMLREHYRWAETEFQRSFLDWSLTVQDMARGYSEISVRELSECLKALDRDYPEELEPRLAPPFRRLYLCLDGIFARSSQIGMDELKVIEGLMWDFWSTHCLFMSIRYNNGISNPRLEGYKKRAESELTAFKRRLNSVLETNYLGSGDYKLDSDSLKFLSTLYQIRVYRFLRGDGTYSVPATR